MQNPLSKLGTFLKESHGEAKKVNWPTKQRTLQNTILVIIFSVVVAIFLNTFDLLFSNLLERFIL
ncbi:preprotein translocase subunit SecE [Patescibacteria group bacterium]|nr:preprotein translocase subunit SecE [Patescibacteria group bacterium]